MGMWVGRGRKARAAYGFDDIALVPGALTVNPNEVDISWDLCGRRFDIPIIAAAMDGVVGPKLAIEMGRLGGLAVLNLEGIFARYERPEEVLERFVQIAQEAGADIFVVQSTVTTARHIATEYAPVDLRKLKKSLAIPLIIGNVVTYEACLELIGVGPGAACTSREVLGVGVPQVTATADAAAARDLHYKQTGRYVPIITDGGMTTGGDVCKALASGADAVLIGSVFACAIGAP